MSKFLQPEETADFCELQGFLHSLCCKSCAVSTCSHNIHWDDKLIDMDGEPERMGTGDILCHNCAQFKIEMASRNPRASPEVHEDNVLVIPMMTDFIRSSPILLRTETSKAGKGSL